MKKILFLLFVGSLFAKDIPMPPSIPNIDLGTKKQKNNPCEIIPPMLINIPPMLENDLDRCKNESYLPTKKFVKKQLKKIFKIDTKIKDIKIVDNFSMLYEIDLGKNKLFCNRYITKCIDGKLIK